MIYYKRNQVEEAIVQTMGAKRDDARELKSRLQRLLVADRRLARKRRGEAKVTSRFAFYSQGAPGSGVEVQFTGYEGFALLTGLIMLEHGIPQLTVVSILRQLRSDLETARRKSLKKDRRRLFDPIAVRAMMKPGMIATDNTDPVFLASVKLSGSTAQRVHAAMAVCKGHEGLSEFITRYSVAGLGSTFFELVSLMHRLADNLAKTRPVKRGRSTI